MPLFITWLRYKWILLPLVNPAGILSMDKKFIITSMNFKWTLYMSSNNKVQNRWDLSLKTSFSVSPSLCFVESNTELWILTNNHLKTHKNIHNGIPVFLMTYEGASIWLFSNFTFDFICSALNVIYCWTLISDQISRMGFILSKFRVSLFRL